jgi:ABC-type multidrug transport system fused ATPase/permease subunit
MFTSIFIIFLIEVPAICAFLFIAPVYISSRMQVRDSGRIGPRDKDFEEAHKYLQRSEDKQTARRNQRAEARLTLNKSLPTSPQQVAVNSAPASTVKKTIFGENIINCRDFSIEGARSFEFVGGFNSAATAPVLGLPEIAFIGRSNVGKSSLLNTLTGANDLVVLKLNYNTRW